jgi:hypothetical protein
MEKPFPSPFIWLDGLFSGLVLNGNFIFQDAVYHKLKMASAEH